MDGGYFQFEYPRRCLVTTWAIEGPTPNIGCDELFYIVPEWYPDDLDSFPGFDGATIVAAESPVGAVSVVRALIWSDGITNPSSAIGVDAALAYLIDVGFTAVVAGRELACFAQDFHFLSRDVDFVDDPNREALQCRYQFLTVDEARREVQG